VHLEVEVGDGVSLLFSASLLGLVVISVGSSLWRWLLGRKEVGKFWREK
jgi:hypothetical protein